jgi:hypothetical protein
MGVTVVLKGGPGSGHYGHKGRPGEQGGSLPEGTTQSATDYGMVWRTDQLERNTDSLIKTVVITPKEKKALKNYKYGKIDRGYLQINRQLRGQSEPTELVTQDIELIDNAIEKNILQDDYVVYRGFSQNPNSQFILKPGLKFKDAGFISTSLSVNRPLNLAKTPEWTKRPQGAIMRFVVPKGSKGVWMDGIVKGMYEHELLLPRGGTFEVGKDITESVPNYLPKGTKGDKNTPRIYEVTYVPG